MQYHVKNLSKQRLIIDLYQSLIFNFGFNRLSYKWIIVQWIIRERRWPMGLEVIDLFDTRQYNGLYCVLSFNSKSKIFLDGRWSEFYGFVRKLNVEGDKTRGWDLIFGNDRMDEIFYSIIIRLIVCLQC